MINDPKCKLISSLLVLQLPAQVDFEFQSCSDDFACLCSAPSTCFDLTFARSLFIQVQTPSPPAATWVSAWSSYNYSTPHPSYHAHSTPPPSHTTSPPHPYLFSAANATQRVHCTHTTNTPNPPIAYSWAPSTTSSYSCVEVLSSPIVYSKQPLAHDGEIRGPKRPGFLTGPGKFPNRRRWGLLGRLRSMLCASTVVVFCHGCFCFRPRCARRDREGGFGLMREEVFLAIVPLDANLPVWFQRLRWT